jgi:hypothetical protein
MTVTGLVGGTTYYFRIKSKDDVNNESGISNEAFATTRPSIIVSNYTGGTPTVPPQYVYTSSTGNCLGTFKFDGTGTISTMTITEYGTCNAANDLENVKLLQDDGDGNWEPSQDTTQLGSTTTFSGTSSTATFSGFNLTAGTATYVHVVLDVLSSATTSQTVGIELYQKDLVCTSTTTASSWPVQLGTSTIKDNIAPAAITNLSALTGDNEGEVKLSWSAPGDDGGTGDINGGRYGIKYATYTSFDFNGPSGFNLEWSTSTTPGRFELKVVTGLSAGTTYYFRVWTADEVLNWSSISNGATTWAQVDVTAPAAITNLQATTGTLVGEIDLQWTAPKEDGTSGGAVSSYDVRYATYSFGDAQWDSVTQATGEPSPPKNPGETETMTVGGLDAGTTYYFRIKSIDDVGNISPIDTTSPQANAMAEIAISSGIVRPNEDSSPLEWNVSEGTAHYEVLNEIVTQPDPGDTGDYIYASGTATDVIGFETISGASGITEVKVWTYCVGYPVNLGVRINMGGWQTQQGFSPSYDPGWASNIFTGSWTETDLDNLLVEYEYSSGSETAWIYTSYCEVTYDNTPPAAITNLSALTGDNAGEIKLSWTAPKEDGTSGGAVSSYDVRYATYSFGDTQWGSVTQATGEPSSPKSPGETENMTVTGLVGGTTYYFRIKSKDDVNNESGISNEAFATTKDNIAPAAITNLSALTGDNEGEVKLSWSAPGDDEWQNNISGGKYGVKWSTYTSFDWDGASNFDLEWTTSTSPGTAESKVITGLTGGTTYYFRIWTADELLNWSSISNGATTWAQVDVTAPAAITDLSGQCDSGTGYVTLSWSTPGDDEWTNTLPSGSKYIIDYSTYSIAWSTATFDVEISTSGVAPHTQVSHTITGLTGDSTWYFQIWTADEVPNWSGLSNGATIWVNPILSVSISTDTYDFGEVPLGQSTHTVSIISVTNDGNIKETYSLKISSVTLYDNSPSLWKSTDTTTGYNRFIFYAIFHGTDVASGYFDLTDAVVDENRSSTSERYTYEDGSPPYKQTGVAVPPGEERKIWFRLDMPTSTTTGKKEKIKVTITAGPE